MRILSKEEAKRIDVDFIYKKGDVLAITEKNFNQRFEAIPRMNLMGSTQLIADMVEGLYRCPSCKHVQRKLGICGGCGKVLIVKRKK